MPTNKNKQHCQSLTTAGAPCRAWAQPGSNPPRCNVHGPHALPANQHRACTASRADGQPCRAWAMHDHHLCSVHARRTIPHTDQHRRCHARTKNGNGGRGRRRCRAWALRHSNPPRCQMHAGNTRPPNHPDHQHHRCQAHTRNGGSRHRHRCRNWATRHSRQQAQHGDAPALCAAHAGQYTLRAPRRHRCSATTAAGQPCPHWALPRSKALYGVRLCRMHLPASDPRRIATRLPRSPHRRCAAKTLHGNGGRRCRHWSLPHDQANGRCWLHAHPHQHPRIRHGYYRRTPHFTPAARAHITKLIRDQHPLHAALLIARLKLQDLSAYLTRRLTHHTPVSPPLASSAAQSAPSPASSRPKQPARPKQTTPPAHPYTRSFHNTSHDPPPQILSSCQSYHLRSPLSRRVL